MTDSEKETKREKEMGMYRDKETVTDMGRDGHYQLIVRGAQRKN